MALLGRGIAKPDFVFIVITLVGKDLHKLRNEQYERRFSLSTAIRVGTECFKAIEELHGCGYISRDIKPGNFAVGLREYQQHRTIFLFDFGLAKRYLDKHPRDFTALVMKRAANRGNNFIYEEIPSKR
uniref:Protein kinase domain-containing protein n=1 Tax=Parascaris equorum TaxID=6256 RepID=A0A914RPT3_PAREQ